MKPTLSPAPRRGLFWITGILLGIPTISVLMSCGVSQLTKGELKPPKVDLRAVGFRAPQPEGWPLICVLAVENPNPVTLRALGYDYEVRLEGRIVAQGASTQPVTLPARGQTLVEVPVLVKLKSLPPLIPRALAGDKLRYEVTGGLRLPQTLGFRVPFRFQGEVNAAEGLERLRPFLNFKSNLKPPAFDTPGYKSSLRSA